MKKIVWVSFGLVLLFSVFVFGLYAFRSSIPSESVMNVFSGSKHITLNNGVNGEDWNNWGMSGVSANLRDSSCDYVGDFYGANTYSFWADTFWENTAVNDRGCYNAWTVMYFSGRNVQTCKDVFVTTGLYTDELPVGLNVASNKVYVANEGCSALSGWNIARDSPFKIRYVKSGNVVSDFTVVPICETGFVRVGDFYGYGGVGSGDSLIDELSCANECLDNSVRSYYIKSDFRVEDLGKKVTFCWS